jgi:hypothetical protein
MRRGGSVSALALPTFEYYRSIAAGNTHACAVRWDRSVQCWGGDANGACDRWTLSAAGMLSIASWTDVFSLAVPRCCSGETTLPAGVYSAVAAADTITWCVVVVLFAWRELRCEVPFAHLAGLQRDACDRRGGVSRKHWPGPARQVAASRRGRQTSMVRALAQPRRGVLNRVTCRVAVSAGPTHSAVNATGYAYCWGDDRGHSGPQSLWPEAKYKEVGAGGLHTWCVRDLAGWLGRQPDSAAVVASLHLLQFWPCRLAWLLVPCCACAAVVAVALTAASNHASCVVQCADDQRHGTRVWQ